MLSFCVRIIIISKGNSVKFNFNTNFAFLSIYTIIILSIAEIIDWQFLSILFRSWRSIGPTSLIHN